MLCLSTDARWKDSFLDRKTLDNDELDDSEPDSIQLDQLEHYEEPNIPTPSQKKNTTKTRTTSVARTTHALNVLMKDRNLKLKQQLKELRNANKEAQKSSAETVRALQKETKELRLAHNTSQKKTLPGTTSIKVPPKRPSKRAPNGAPHRILHDAHARILDNVDELWRKADRSPLFRRGIRRLRLIPPSTIRAVAAGHTTHVVATRSMNLDALGVSDDRFNTLKDRTGFSWTPTTPPSYILALGYCMSLLMQEAAYNARVITCGSRAVANVDSPTQIVKVNREAIAYGFKCLGDACPPLETTRERFLRLV